MKTKTLPVMLLALSLAFANCRHRERNPYHSGLSLDSLFNIKISVDAMRPASTETKEQDQWSDEIHPSVNAACLNWFSPLDLELPPSGRVLEPNPPQTRPTGDGGAAALGERCGCCPAAAPPLTSLRTIAANQNNCRMAEQRRHVLERHRANIHTSCSCRQSLQ